MNKLEIVDLLQTIKGAYGYKFDINEFTSKVWHDALKQKTYLDANELLSKHINKEDQPPTISVFLRTSIESEDQRKRDYVQMMMEAQKKMYEPNL